MTGRQIREKALVATTSSYSLIMVANPGAQSIGLDRVVDICEARDSKFRHFKSDRVYALTINERGFEWGSEEITTAEICEYAEMGSQQGTHQFVR